MLTSLEVPAAWRHRWPMVSFAMTVTRKRTTMCARPVLAPELLFLTARITLKSSSLALRELSQNWPQ